MARTNKRGQPKGDKRQRTRTALLEAARVLIREQDFAYERVTMEDVARRAGMTTGAIYGNFKNRAELFAALGQVYWAPVKPVFKKGASFAQVMRAFARATLSVLPDRQAAAVGRLTGIAHALTNPDLRARGHEIHGGRYEFG